MSVKIVVFYFFHVGFVAGTVVLAWHSGFSQYYLLVLISLPLLLALSPRFGDVSYALNFRLLFPISVGLFFVFLYHDLPNFISDSSELSRYGILQNSTLDESFFVVNPVFKDAVSVLYAICAAFLLLKGLNDFDELKHTLYDEANQIRSICDFLVYFKEPNGIQSHEPEAVSRLKVLLLTYSNNILDGKRVVVTKENEQVLQKCILETAKLEHKDYNDGVAIEEIMKGISRLSMLRAQRIVCIEKRMSPYILALMVLMSLAMVLSFFGNLSQGFSIEYVYVFLLPTFYAAIFMTLFDLSSPFDGYWAIKLGALTETKEWLENQTENFRLQ